MIRLLLVRHGNTFEKGQTPTQVGARTDLHLTEQGRRQAQSFADYLSANHIKPDAIYAGSLKRQIETAQILGSHHHETALTEIDYGAWEGLTTEEITKQWPNEYHAWTTQAKWPTIFGSTQENHLNAIKKWLEALRKKHASGQTIVGVTSNGVIRYFYSLQNREWQNLINSSRMEDLKVKTGHFCELLLTSDSLKAESWNVDPKNLH